MHWTINIINAVFVVLLSSCIFFYSLIYSLIWYELVCSLEHIFIFLEHSKANLNVLIIHKRREWIKECSLHGIVTHLKGHAFRPSGHIFLVVNSFGVGYWTFVSRIIIYKYKKNYKTKQDRERESTTGPRQVLHRLKVLPLRGASDLIVW